MQRGCEPSPSGPFLTHAAFYFNLKSRHTNRRTYASHHVLTGSLKGTMEGQSDRIIACFKTQVSIVL